MNYSEKLKDPRWQKKRLEILQRDEFKCKLCGDKDHTLHIHHVKYEGQPWDVDSKYLKTVCIHCHALLESIHKDDGKYIIGATKYKFLDRFSTACFFRFPERDFDQVLFFTYENSTGCVRYFGAFSAIEILQVYDTLKLDYAK